MARQLFPAPGTAPAWLSAPWDPAEAVDHMTRADGYLTRASAAQDALALRRVVARLMPR